MKKLLAIAIIALGLTSCSGPDNSTKTSPNIMASKFINLEKISQEDSAGENISILRDKYTDVL